MRSAHFPAGYPGSSPVWTLPVQTFRLAWLARLTLLRLAGLTGLTLAGLPTRAYIGPAGGTRLFTGYAGSARSGRNTRLGSTSHAGSTGAGLARAGLAGLTRLPGCARTALTGAGLAGLARAGTTAARTGCSRTTRAGDTLVRSGLTGARLASIALADTGLPRCPRLARSIDAGVALAWLPFLADLADAGFTLLSR